MEALRLERVEAGAKSESSVMASSREVGIASLEDVDVGEGGKEEGVCEIGGEEE